MCLEWGEPCSSCLGQLSCIPKSDLEFGLDQFPCVIPCLATPEVCARVRGASTSEGIMDSGLVKGDRRGQGESLGNVGACSL